jgi:pyrimidine-nucleoside phosphorylase/thymidine phosphorylase
MKDRAKAQALAASMVAIGTRAGVRTEAFLTDMDSPLGRTVGNALEIAECLDTLKGRGPEDLTSVVTRLAARMTMLAGIEATANAALARATDALASGRALDVFTRMVERQGGDPRVADDYGLMPVAPDRESLTAWTDGVVTRVLAGSIGRATHHLGAGRTTVGEPVDHAVGLRMQVVRGERVRKGQPLLELHHRGGRGLEAARALCREAIHIDEAAPAMPAPDRILGEVR